MTVTERILKTKVHTINLIIQDEGVSIGWEEGYMSPHEEWLRDHTTSLINYPTIEAALNALWKRVKNK